MLNKIKTEFFTQHLTDPVTKKEVNQISSTEIIFKCGSKYPIISGIPVIIDENESIFKIKDILKQTPTTQDSEFRKKSLKTLIRQKAIPSLSKDFTFNKRYEALAEKFKKGNVLIIGAGDKIDWYNQIFKESIIITSDVHLQFKPDFVLDSHQIPFCDESFDLVIAGQVLEHTFQPWVVANEIQRVAKTNGNILIEVPFNFPYHSPPYDFFRFTFTGLRSLFKECGVSSFEVPEGNASTIASFNSQFLIDLSSNRFIRIFMLFLSRILFGWMKYIDLIYKKNTLRKLSLPKGFSMTFNKDTTKRSNLDLLDEYYSITNK